MTVQQVPFLSMLGMALTLIISAGLPIVLFIYWRKKLDARISSLVFGAMVYYVAAKLLEPYINAAILSNLGGAVMNNMFVYAIYVALIATVIEEGLRYLSIKTLIRDCDEDNALMFGLGFGGLEALMVAAWPQVSNILNSILINNGLMAQSLSLLQEPELSSTYFAIAPLWETSSTAFLLAGFERGLMVLMHICLSLVLFYYLKTKEKKYIAVALGAHFAVVACSALMTQLGASIFSVLTTAVVVAALTAFTLKTHRTYQSSMSADTEAAIE